MKAIINHVQLVIGDTEIYPQVANMNATMSITEDQLKIHAIAPQKSSISVVLNYKNTNGVECSSSSLSMFANSGSGGLIYLASGNTRFYTDIKIN